MPPSRRKTTNLIISFRHFIIGASFCTGTQQCATTKLRFKGKWSQCNVLAIKLYRRNSVVLLSNSCCYGPACFFLTSSPSLSPCQTVFWWIISFSGGSGSSFGGLGWKSRISFISCHEVAMFYKSLLPPPLSLPGWCHCISPIRTTVFRFHKRCCQHN